MSEGIIFSVAALTIFGEAYRSSRQTTRRKEGVDEALKDLQGQVQELQRLHAAKNEVIDEDLREIRKEIGVLLESTERLLIEQQRVVQVASASSSAKLNEQ